MKKTFIALITLMSCTSIYSQNNSATTKSTMTKTITKAIEYYNNQNWADLKKLYADTVKVYEFPDKLRDSGVDELIAHYPKTFERYPNNKAKYLTLL